MNVTADCDSRVTRYIHNNGKVISSRGAMNMQAIRNESADFP